MDRSTSAMETLMLSLTHTVPRARIVPVGDLGILSFSSQPADADRRRWLLPLPMLARISGPCPAANPIQSRRGGGTIAQDQSDHWRHRVRGFHCPESAEFLEFVPGSIPGL